MRRQSLETLADLASALQVCTICSCLADDRMPACQALHCRLMQLVSHWPRCGAAARRWTGA